MKPLACIVLAAGESSRFKSAAPKPLHTIGGRTLLDRVLGTISELQPDRVTVVVGVAREQMEQTLSEYDVEIAVQEEQLGTGHAVDRTRSHYADFVGDILVTCADIPLVRAETLRSLIDEHQSRSAAATMLTTLEPDPTGYGRVIRDDSGLVARVVEHNDADEETRRINEINAGIFCFDAMALFEALTHLDNHNASGEYYLPDTLKYLRERGLPVAAWTADDPTEVMGINDRVQLATADRICRDRTRDRLMRAGVTMIDPAAAYVDDRVEVGGDTVIWPGACILGASTIGCGCQIGDHVLISNSHVGDGCLLRHCSSVTDSHLENDVQIGPFANIRGNSVIRARATIGQAEVNRSEVGPDTKAIHFSYLGDATVGAGVNIGAGAITCNYDGRRKNQTIIEDGAFIGSDTMLVAPVRIGRGAYTAAGSVITADVPAAALGVARAKQKIIERWAERVARDNDK